MARILITIPTWNEAVVVRDTLMKVRDAASRYLSGHDVVIEVADNGSTDGTREIVRETGTASLLELGERGKGRAIRSSWERHLNDADVLCFTDADLAADLSALPSLVDPILRNAADVVCGSRFARGAVTDRRFARELASRLFRRLQHAALRLPVEDAQCGFKAISREAATNVLPFCVETAWLFDSELLAVAVRKKRRIREIPVSWVEHRDPRRRSALRLFRDGWGFLLGLAKIRHRVFRLG